jgi:hypothetical protein
MFCTADNCIPKMAAAGPSEPSVPTCEKVHSITEDIFIVNTVRTADKTMEFCFYFSFTWKGESLEVQAYLNLFLTAVVKTVCMYTCIVCQFAAYSCIL